MFATKSDLNDLEREFQREGYLDFIHDCACKVMDRFPDAKDFTESDIEDFIIENGIEDRKSFYVYEFRTWLCGGSNGYS